jgi:hypothetical protein
MRYQNDRTFRRWLGWLPAIALTAVLGAAPARSAGPVDGSEAARLPAGTLMLVSVAGIDELWGQLQQTGLWKLVQQLPEVPEQIEAGWAQFAAEFERNSGVPFQDVRQLLSGSIAFALTDLDIAAAETSGIPPGMLVTLDLRGHMAQWNAVVEQKLLPQLEEELKGGGGAYLQEDWQGSKLHVFRSPDDEAKSFFAVVHQERLVLTTQRALLEGFFPQAAGGPSLMDAPAYRWARSKIGEPGFVFLYADAGGLWKAARSYVAAKADTPEEQQNLRIVDALGLDDFTAIAWGSRVVQNGVLDRFAIGLAPQPKGIARLFANLSPAPLASLRLAPKDAILYSGTSLGNVGELFGEIVRLLREALPPEALAELDKGLAEFRTNTGMDLQQDVLAQLSGELGFVLALPDIPTAILENPIVGALGKLNEIQLGLYLGVVDPSAFEAKLEELLQKSGVASTAEQHAGISYRLFSIPGSPVFPGYAMVGNLLVVGLNAPTLKTAIDLSKGGEGLTSAPRYQKAMSVLSVKEGSSTGYVDLPGIIEVAGRLALAQAKKMQQAGQPLPFDLAALPSPEQLAALVPPMATKSSVGPEGMVGEYFSPFGYMAQVAVSSGMSAYQAMEQRKAGEQYGDEPTAEPYEDEPAAEPYEDGPTAEPYEDEPAAEEPAAEPVAGGTQAAAARQAPPAPAGWSVSSSAENMTAYLSGDYQGSATWFRSPFLQHMRLDAMIAQVKTSSASLPSFQVLREGPIELGELRGSELVYEMGEQQNRQRLRLVYVHDGQNLYTLTLQCAVSKCDEYQQAFDAIVAGLK